MPVTAASAPMSCHGRAVRGRDFSDKPDSLVMGGVIDGLVVNEGPQAALREQGHVVIPLAITGTYFVPVEDIPAPGNLVPGFLELTEKLAEEAAEASSAGPVLYLHMEFHGGAGTHDAMGWHKGAAAFGPLFTRTPREAAAEQYVAVQSGRDMAINAGLRWLGVKAAEGKDEYATLGLDRYRWNADWLASIAK